jgi:CheY-like chemotaxis protein
MEVQASCRSALPGQLKCRILLVEDNQEHRPLLSTMLGKAGSAVTVAENGRVGIDRARAARDAAKPFDIIVMDVQMPVLDGVAATRQLRAEGFTNPIIALTARAVSSERDRCLAAGCDDFLVKPITRADLVRLLAGHLRRSQDRNQAEQN